MYWNLRLRNRRDKNPHRVEIREVDRLFRVKQSYLRIKLRLVSQAQCLYIQRKQPHLVVKICTEIKVEKHNVCAERICPHLTRVSTLKIKAKNVYMLNMYPKNAGVRYCVFSIAKNNFNCETKTKKQTKADENVYCVFQC